MSAGQKKARAASQKVATVEATDKKQRNAADTMSIQCADKATAAQGCGGREGLPGNSSGKCSMKLQMVIASCNSEPSKWVLRQPWPMHSAELLLQQFEQLLPQHKLMLCLGHMDTNVTLYQNQATALENAVCFDCG